MLKEVSQEGTFGTKMKKQKKRINKAEKQSQAEIRVHSETPLRVMRMKMLVTKTVEDREEVQPKLRSGNW